MGYFFSIIGVAYFIWTAKATYDIFNDFINVVIKINKTDARPDAIKNLEKYHSYPKPYSPKPD